MSNTDEMDRRYGRMKFPEVLARISPSRVSNIMAWLKAVVCRAEFNFCERCLEYELYSPRFKSLALGEMMPEYRVIITKDAIGNEAYSIENAEEVPL